MVDRTPPRTYGSVGKLRYSFDDEQRARLLDYDGDLSTPADSPRALGRVESAKARRRRRPLLVAVSFAAVLLLLASAGAYRNPSSVESLSDAVGIWREKVGWTATEAHDQPAGAPGSGAAADKAASSISWPVIEPPATQAEDSPVFNEAPVSPLPEVTEELPQTPAADSADIPHLLAPPEDPVDAPEIELSTGQIEDAPAAVPAEAETVPASVDEPAQASAFHLQGAPAGFPAYMASSKFLDTKPSVRAPPVDPTGERYLSYNPHSGFHNQRIEFENALVLAQLLNRTLLAPLVRLGRPQGWQATPQLQQSLEHAEKLRLTDCIDQLEQLEKNEVPGRCENYTQYTHVSWETLINVEPLEANVRLVDRVDISRDWFVSSEGLGLAEDDIESFRDPSRYTLRFYDSKSDNDAPGRYRERVYIDDLRDGPLASKKLLEFGSFFGSARLKLSSEHRSLGRAANRQMVFRNDLLTNTSNELVRRLGGRDAYIGLHLRVGDGPFKRTATKNMQRVWRTLATDVFKLERKAATDLYTAVVTGRQTRKQQHQARQETIAAYQSLDSLDLDFFAQPAYEDFTIGKRALHPSLTCRGQLHADPNLVGLNRPVYIATDAAHPRSNPDLAVFFQLLPCAFVLGDFADVPGLKALEEVRSLQEGVKMAPFLYPFLEAMMAARSRIATIGTPGSTFSSFAATTLHRTYAQEPGIDTVEAEQGESDE